MDSETLQRSGGARGIFYTGIHGTSCTDLPPRHPWSCCENTPDAPGPSKLELSAYITAECMSHCVNGG